MKIVVRPLLSWRSDPSESFSDWQVQVRTMGSREVEEFHVHRNIVGFGPRKSGYFAKQFIYFTQKAKTDPTLATVSRLTVPAVEAKVFGFALDYLYLTEGQMQPTMTAEKACAVFKLAERLEMPSLQTTLAEFYRKHLNATNMGKFLRAAKKLNAERLTFVAKARIGSMITDDPTLARLIKPRFLAELASILNEHRQLVMRQVQQSRPDAYQSLERNQSKRWSRAIYCCSMVSDNDFTAAILNSILDEQVLPAVDGSIALYILQLSAKVNDLNSAPYQSLEVRCGRGILEDFDMFRRGFDSRQGLLESIQSLLTSPRLIEEIMDRAENLW
jgi:hypothetical protein